MAEAIEEDVSLRLQQCFEDIDNLLCTRDQERNTTTQPVIERIISKLEISIEFLLQIIPLVNESRSVLNEITTNLQIICHGWCRKLNELELRTPPKCTHLAVYSLYLPQVTASARPGRPKFDISEDVLLNSKSPGLHLERNIISSSCLAYDSVAKSGRTWNKRGNRFF